MLMLLALFGCNRDILFSSGELGRINYTIVTGYQIDGLSTEIAGLYNVQYL